MIGPGGYFGELGPMLNMPRSATAQAITDCTLVGYGVQMFRSLGSPARVATPAPAAD